MKIALTPFIIQIIMMLNHQHHRIASNHLNFFFFFFFLFVLYTFSVNSLYSIPMMICYSLHSANVLCHEWHIKRLTTNWICNLRLSFSTVVISFLFIFFISTPCFCFSWAFVASITYFSYFVFVFRFPPFVSFLSENHSSATITWKYHHQL